MKKKILIIDDDLIYRKILQRLLCSKYELILVDNDKQALDILDFKRDPDLIIADINIPGVVGLEFIKQLVIKIEDLRIPIIVISGMDDEKLKKEVISYGIHEYLYKPIEREYLKEVISNVMQ